MGVALNYASCEAIDLSSLREDDTNNEDKEEISCDDWESPHPASDGWGGLSLCETRDLFCDQKGEDMISDMEKLLEDLKGSAFKISSDFICLVKNDLEVLEPIIKDCNQDIACDDKN